MYENQEAYKMKKKEFQQAEIQFRVKEHELKDRDQEIQESLITFANYLDTNQRAMKKSDLNIALVTDENEKKDSEISRKEKQLAILRQKAKRIEKRKLAVEQYQIYLEKVREKNSDEYSEISDILARYTTLTDAHFKLKGDLEAKEKQLAEIKASVVKYEKDMNTEIMKLNNNIA
jgi:predicted  nucleic acid-binding Zn-ribbon protein